MQKSICLKSENNGSERVIKKRLSTGLRIKSAIRKHSTINYLKNKKKHEKFSQ